MTDNDEALGEAVETDAAEVESFDLEEWLNGLVPVRRAVIVAGKRFVLQARTNTWLQARVAELAAEDGLTQLQQNLQITAEHIVEPEGVTRAHLERIYEVREAEVDNLTACMAELDTKPEYAISPRFLRVASA